MDPATLVMGAIGLGLGLFSSHQQAKSQRDMYNQQMSALQSINTQQTATMPELPTAPSDEPGAATNDEADAEREKVLRASSQNNSRFNPTGGLGLTSLPNLYKRTLGGAA